jgi:hypothetical protein
MGVVDSAPYGKDTSTAALWGRASAHPADTLCPYK